jgi:hypothetical protein
MGFAALYPSYRSNKPEITNRMPRRNGFGGGDDGMGIDAAAKPITFSCAMLAR